MNHSFARSLAVGAVTVAMTFAAGGAAAANVAIPFQLNWMAGGANAGFAAAVVEGYYKDAGLDVTVIQGNGSGNTTQRIFSLRRLASSRDAAALSVSSLIVSMYGGAYPWAVTVYS